MAVIKKVPLTETRKTTLLREEAKRILKYILQDEGHRKPLTGELCEECIDEIVASLEWATEMGKTGKVDTEL